jgi:hypothetical protein
MAGQRAVSPELLAEDKGTDIADHELGPMRMARRLLFRGEALQGQDFAAAHGCSPSIVSQAAKQLETSGYTIVREYAVREVDGGKMRRVAFMRMVDPKEVPKPAKANVPVVVNGGAPPPAADPPSPGDVADVGESLPPLPGIGQPLVCYAQVLNDDGTITIGIRNGTHKWLTTVTGALPSNGKSAPSTTN